MNVAGLRQGSAKALAAASLVAIVVVVLSTLATPWGSHPRALPERPRSPASNPVVNRGCPGFKAAPGRSLDADSGLTGPEAIFRTSCIPARLAHLHLTRSAIRQAQAMAIALPARPRGRRGLTQAGTWSPINPGPMANGWGGRVSGRVDSLAWDANLGPNGTLFAGANDGGVWRTANGGTTWTTHTDNLPSLAIGAIAVDPTDPSGQTLYAGSGSLDFGRLNEPSILGAGVYKTMDGGNTWSVTGAGVIGNSAISAIAVDPVTGDIYAASRNTDYLGHGIFMSTDHGATWSNPSNLAGDSVSDLAIDTHGDLYAAVGGYPGAAPSDAGVWFCSAPCASHPTFVTMRTGLPAISGGIFTLSLANPGASLGSQILFDGLSSTRVSPPSTSVYRTINGGSPGSTSWSRIAATGTFAHYDQGWVATVYADPADPSGNTLYAGLSGIYKTTDALDASPTWQVLNNSSVHPDQRAHPVRGGTAIYFGNDGGVFSTADGGDTFSNDVGNLAITEFSGGGLGGVALGTTPAEGCTANCDPNLVVGGTQDNGTPLTNSALQPGWNQILGGDGGAAAVNPKNNNDVIYEVQSNSIHESTDGGATDQYDISPGVCGTPFWLDPVLQDQSAPDHVWVGVSDICETNNAISGVPSPTWADIGPTGVPHRDAVEDLTYSHAGGQPALFGGDIWGNSFVQAPARNGGAWTSMNSTSCGTTIGPNCGGDQWAGLTRLAADPVHPGTLYATDNAYQAVSELHVFKSTDYGTHWTDISGNLPDEPFWSLAVNPGNPNEIFVGGMPGVFMSADGGSSWRVLGTGLPNSWVADLTLSADGKTIDAFTYGRGAWTTPVPTVTSTPLTITAGSPSIPAYQALQPISPSYTGLVAGDSLSTPAVCVVAGATTGQELPPGTYETSCSGASDPYYAITYQTGTLTVTNAPLTITAASYSLGRGADLPTLGWTASGFVHGDTSASLSSPPSCQTSVTTDGFARITSSPGPYTITCNGASAPSYYDVVYVSGTLTVTAEPTISADNKSVSYHAMLPALTWTANFDSGHLTTQPTCSTVATTDGSGHVTSPAGNYSIACTGAVDPTFTPASVNGTLHVSEASTKLNWSGLLSLHHGKPATLSATLRTATGVAVSGRTITFTIGTGATKQTCKGVTSGTGLATCHLIKLKAAIGHTTVSMSFAGDPAGKPMYYAKSSATKRLTVTK